MVMVKPRAAVTAAAIAVVSAAAATASEPARATEGGSATTGRALISIRTPALPTADGRAAALRRGERIDRSRELLLRVADRNAIEVEARSDAGGLLATDLDGTSIAELRAGLASDPLVESVRPEGQVELRYTPNEPLFMSPDVHAPLGDALQWHLIKQSFPGAWDTSKGIGAEVAVIDSGADVSHPDLAPRLNGALNCVGATCTGSDVTDTVGHGTHVSGLACADSDNAYGLASAGFDCSLFVIRVSTGGPITYTAIINAIYAAANRGSDVINLSLGGGSGDDPDLRAAIDYAFARGSILVAAGANTPNPPPNYPGEYIQPQGSGANIDAGKGVVVTSVSHTGSRSAFAEAGTGVSLAAFGSASDLISCEGFQQGVISTWPAAPTDTDTACGPVPARTTLAGDDRFAYLVGTSMASPQVAGLAALMRSANQSLSAARAVRLLKLTASNCGNYTNGIGWGVIRADRAVAAALDRDVDPPGSRVRSAKKRRGRATLRLRRSDPTCAKDLQPAGIKTVNVFASANGGRYRRVAKTKKKKVRFRIKRGRRYRFYSIAVDRDGNREAPPEKADAKLRVKR
jgi:serine protease